MNFRWLTIMLIYWASVAVLAKASANEPISNKTTVVIASPNQVSKVELHLQPANQGASLVALHNGIKQKQVELVSRNLKFKPEVRWHGEDFLAVRIRAAAADETIYYDLLAERQSQPLANVLAFDRNAAVAANVDQNRLRLVSVFAIQQAGQYHDGNSLLLEAKFPAGRSLLEVIKRAEFTPNGDFLMRYEVGNNVLMGVRVGAQQIQFEPPEEQY